MLLNRHFIKKSNICLCKSYKMFAFIVSVRVKFHHPANPAHQFNLILPLQKGRPRDCGGSLGSPPHHSATALTHPRYRGGLTAALGCLLPLHRDNYFITVSLLLLYERSTFVSSFPSQGKAFAKGITFLVH